ncbi:YfgM family protein [Arenimonas sp.]|uniref:YfgM family protein n=1 Tax=Arenimonas sp. TaxID=1872635 RepID=UPI0035B41CAB
MDQIDEYEQGERVRAWLKNNGSSLITGIALGLAALGGWQWWQGQGEQRKVEAASEFLAYTRASEGEQTDKALAHAEALRQNHPETPYVALVAINEAQRLLEAGKAEEGLARLDAVDASELDPAMAELLQLRAMRLLAALGRHEDVIKRLDAHPLPSYPGVASELRGDAELALGNREQARAAYEQALAALDVGAATRGIIEMKFTAAGGRLPETPEA